MRRRFFAIAVSFAALPAAAQSGGNQVTIERASASPGIREATMREFLSGKLGVIDACVPDLLPETSELDDRVAIKFVVESGGQLRSRSVTVRGLVDENCLVEQAKSWKFPKPNGAQPVEVEWFLRLKPDVERSRRVRADAKRELADYCDAFKKRLKKSPKSEWEAGAALTDFLRSRGGKNASDDPLDWRNVNLGQLRLTAFGRLWAEGVLNVNPADQEHIALSAAEELGVPCPELSMRRPSSGN